MQQVPNDVQIIRRINMKYNCFENLLWTHKLSFNSK